MPQEHKSRREILDAIRSLPAMADLLAAEDGKFLYEIDLEVVVYGRNYNGKKVGPYVRLLTYEPGETIVEEGDWGGNTFYAVVDGHVDLFSRHGEQGDYTKVAEQQSGTQFGEMSVLAGVPRNVTVKAPPHDRVRILELQRPALRLLRKLPKFGETLNRTYRSHGRNSALEYLKRKVGLSQDLIDQLRSICLYRVYPKNHVLFHKGAPVDRVMIVIEGWIHRTIEEDDKDVSEDYLGRGHCFGLEATVKRSVWPYTAQLSGRTEVLEISADKIKQNPALAEALAKEFARFAAPKLESAFRGADPSIRDRVLKSQAALIDTGLVDATNLLVMDMDLCVRCGNCSLACHKIHGKSRLVRHGIHVARLKLPSLTRIQSVLSPQVCMHCKDPECLTGCPTGAIGRFDNGQVDITANLCIGCGDCATNCPYDAISMVARKGGSDKSSGLLQSLLRLSADPLPTPVEQTEDLLAVKCNLCEGTPLNKNDRKRPAYSCEENCPTGALARIDPRKYFTEIGGIEGFLKLDHSHAIGRNIHRSDPLRKLIHFLGILLTAGSTAGAILLLQQHGMGEMLYSFLNMRWLTALAGLAAIIGVMTYPMRRQVYRKRRGALRYWMLIHSYLGVIAAVMIYLHGGTHSGGALTLALMLSFDATILSGIFGILSYTLVPRLLTRIEGSPLLLDDLRARRRELEEELANHIRKAPEVLRKRIMRTVNRRYLTTSYLLQHYIRRRSLESAVRSATKRNRPIASKFPEEADRKRFDSAVEAAVTMRRVDALIYLHRLLKLWLPPHVIATALMIALMIVHIIQVFYYAPW